MDLELSNPSVYRRIRSVVGFGDTSEVAMKQTNGLHPQAVPILIGLAGLILLLAGGYLLLKILSDREMVKPTHYTNNRLHYSPIPLSPISQQQPVYTSQHSPPNPLSPNVMTFSLPPPSQSPATISSSAPNLAPLPSLKDRLVGLPNGYNICYMNAGLQILFSIPELEEVMDNYIKPIFNDPQTRTLLQAHQDIRAEAILDQPIEEVKERKQAALAEELARFKAFIELFNYIKKEPYIDLKILRSKYLLPLAQAINVADIKDIGDAKEAQEKLINPMIDCLNLLSIPLPGHSKIDLNQKAAEATAQLNRLFTMTLQEMQPIPTDDGSTLYIPTAVPYDAQFFTGYPPDLVQPAAATQKGGKPSSITDCIVEKQKLGTCIIKLPEYLRIDPVYFDGYGSVYQNYINVPLSIAEKDIVLSTTPDAVRTDATYELTSFVEYQEYGDIGHFVAYTKKHGMWYQINDNSILECGPDITKHPLIKPYHVRTHNPDGNRINSLIYKRVTQPESELNTSPELTKPALETPTGRRNTQ
ncbi:hypothetical protein NEHOM01_1178 [Nematocida homosporus]|uniref:uncharacterized protein n=1 Tax=Nematocida homosporus TaxID=1912981 RepID=UPI00221F11AD|nr:uncharacterized protein NEHOM01_1178 [Nematocida homosporus]KAI5185955.1 hypothetical protein NEHOM01_1178 [Nematocida homosporus]